MRMRTAAVVVVTAAVAGALGFASRAPYEPAVRGDALLRLSWRLRGERIEQCRDRSAAELEALPAHMRTPRECTVQLVSYRLGVKVDGKTVAHGTFAPAGAKGDRPIFVLQDIPIEPGSRNVLVEFAPELDGRRALRFEGAVNAAQGTVNMITTSPDAQTLVLRAK
jgi:hypothetical protein